MRILVLSDTHVPRMARNIPMAVYDEAKNCDLVLHAGDFTGIGVFERLKKLKKQYKLWNRKFFLKATKNLICHK